MSVVMAETRPRIQVSNGGSNTASPIKSSITNVGDGRDGLKDAKLTSNLSASCRVINMTK